MTLCELNFLIKVISCVSTFTSTKVMEPQSPLVHPFSFRKNSLHGLYSSYCLNFTGDYVTIVGDRIRRTGIWEQLPVFAVIFSFSFITLYFWLAFTWQKDLCLL
jgi:hypothetical protein